MVKKIVYCIVEKMKSCIGNDNGYGLCEQLKDGRIILVDHETNEKKYVGLTDNIGDYFYIRSLKPYVSEKPSRGARVTGSCITQHEVSVDLRLIGSWKCTDPEKILNALKYCLISSVNEVVKKNSNSFQNIIGKASVKFNQTSTSFEEIYKEETGKDEISWNDSENLALIDFNLSFRYDYCNVELINIC